MKKEQKHGFKVDILSCSRRIVDPLSGIFIVNLIKKVSIKFTINFHIENGRLERYNIVRLMEDRTITRPKIRIRIIMIKNNTALLICTIENNKDKYKYLLII